MGYYTDFYYQDNDEDVIRAINQAAGYGDSVCGEVDGEKWYDWKDDIIAVSKMFPDKVIRIEGVGEDNSFGDVDQWEAYAKGGKLYISKAEVVFKEYEEYTK